MLLTHLGYHYDSPGGNFLQKLHPSSFLLAAGCALFAASQQLSSSHSAGHPSLTATAVYLYLTVSYACYIAIALSRPATFVFDSLIAPFIALILICNASGRTKFLIAVSIHLAMAANALIGIAESQTGWRLIPFYLDGIPIDYDWRATALFGHPLQNALITSIYAMLLVMGQHFGIGRTASAIALVVQIAALPSFGARAATVGLFAIILAVVAVRALLILAGKRFNLTSLALSCALAILALMVGLIAVESGYIGKFITRFAEDDGSAQTRVRMFRVFEALGWEDLLLGPSSVILSHLQIREGVSIAIESFIVAYILQSGIIAASFVFIGLFVLSYCIWTKVGWQGKVALIFFFVINATSTGIASKTVIMTQAVALIMVMSTNNRSAALVPRPLEN